jgi:hypothetical protein
MSTSPNLTPKVKITLALNSGATAAYKPGSSNDAGGVKEAIVLCMLTGDGDITARQRIDLLRSDIPGADWTALDRAGGVPELSKRLTIAAKDLLDGHDPHVVFNLGAKGSLEAAHLVTNGAEVKSELAADATKRSLVVPRLLPYQLGAGAAGVCAVLFKPVAGGNIRIHSMHPTQQEANVAEKTLQQAGEKSTGMLMVTTAVTALLADVAAGRYKAPAPVAAAAPAAADSGDIGAGGRATNPGLKSPLRAGMSMGSPSPL